MTISSTWQKYNLFASLNDKPTKIGQIVEQKDSAQKIIKRDTIYDFNNDGISDLKVYQKNGKISVFINQNQINSSQPQWKGTSEYGSTLDDVGKNIIAKHLTPTIKSVPITTSKNNPFQICALSKSIRANLLNTCSNFCFFHFGAYERIEADFCNALLNNNFFDIILVGIPRGFISRISWHHAGTGDGQCTGSRIKIPFGRVAAITACKRFCVYLYRSNL